MALGKQVKSTVEAVALQHLGYSLWRGRVDDFGMVWKYTTYPMEGSGPVSRFDSINDVRKYIKQVIEVRGWQE